MRSSFLLTFIVAALQFPAIAPAQNKKDKDKSSVRTLTVRKGDLEPTIHATGVLRPQEVIEICPAVSAVVVKVGSDPRDPKKTIEAGTLVQEGTVLAELDAGVFRARLDQAKARVLKVEAESRLADLQLRQADLLIKNLERIAPGAADELARARYEHDLARAQSEIQRAALLEAEAVQQEALLHYNATTIRSPVKGVIVARHVKLGQAVAPGAPVAALFVIAKDVEKMEVVAQVPEADRGLVALGQAVSFRIDGNPKDTFNGVVAQVRPGSGSTRTVIIKFVNTGGKLPPNLAADLTIAANPRKDALLVPNAALSWFPEPKQVVAAARPQLTELDSLRKDGSHRVLWVEEKNLVRPLVIRGSDRRPVDRGAGRRAEGGDRRRDREVNRHKKRGVNGHKKREKAQKKTGGQHGSLRWLRLPTC